LHWKRFAIEITGIIQPWHTDCGKFLLLRTIRPIGADYRGAQIRDAVCNDTIPHTTRLDAGAPRQNGRVCMKRFSRLALQAIAGVALLCATATPAQASLVLAAGPDQGTFATNNYGYSGTYYSGSPETLQSHPGGGPVAILFVFGANGQISTYTDSSAGTYDDVEDTQIGVLNLSGSTLTSMKLTATSGDPFGFDGDGISALTSAPTGTAQGSNAPRNAQDSSDGKYGGPMTYFTLSAPGSTGDFTTSGSLSAYANFVGGLASGSSTYFSLEGNPSDLANLGSTMSAPEPASMVMAVTGALMVFGYGKRRRKAAQKV
jgi:hypothetical protein